jgi:hypothetical protein
LEVTRIEGYASIKKASDYIYQSDNQILRPGETYSFNHDDNHTDTFTIGIRNQDKLTPSTGQHDLHMPHDEIINTIETN